LLSNLYGHTDFAASRAALAAFLGIADDDFDIVIPGHGEVSDRAGLMEHRNKLVKLRDRVISLKHAGKSYSEIAKVMQDEYGWKPEDRDLGQWTFPGMMKELQ